MSQWSRTLGLLVLGLVALFSCDDRSDAGVGLVLDEAIGIETLGGVFTPIVPEGVGIPVTHSEILSTAMDNQSSVEVHVLAGNGSMAADNRTLGRFHVIDIRAAPRGVPQVEVTLEVDTQGSFRISAVDLSQAKGSELQVTNSALGGKMIVRTRPK